jgi:hypothetical protein
MRLLLLSMLSNLFGKPIFSLFREVVCGGHENLKTCKEPPYMEVDLRYTLLEKIWRLHLNITMGAVL